MSKISEMPMATAVNATDLVEIVQGGVNKRATLQTVALAGPAGAAGKSAYELAVQAGFVGNQSAWFASLKGTTGNTGATGAQGVQGLQGIKGDTGNTGLGAYQTAVANGFGGTEQEWLATLVGPQGPQGLQGTPGLNGGVDGKSAYEIAVLGGFVGNQAAWLLSLKGTNGAQGLQGTAGAAGAAGPQGIQGLQGAPGIAGKSAFEVAVYNGYSGTEVQWLISLRGATGAAGADGATGATGLTGPTGIQGIQGIQGPQGTTGNTGSTGATGPAGASAYQVAVSNGFVGTQLQWLASLKGEKGDPGVSGDGSGGVSLTSFQALQDQVDGMAVILAQVNRSPQLLVDSNTGTVGATSLTGNVLNNDDDPEALELTIVSFVYGGGRYNAGALVTTPYGTFTLNSSGFYTYAVTALGNQALPLNQTTTETFTYRVVDPGGAMAETTLSVHLVGGTAGTPPTAVADNATITKNAVASGNVLANDMTGTGGALSVTAITVDGNTYAVPATVNLPNVATITMATNGAWSVTPYLDYVGNIPNVLYNVTNGTDTISATLFLAVQVGPVSGPSNPVTTALTGSVATLNVYSDADLDAIPFGSLQAGTVINIYWKNTPYTRKLALRGRGTFSNPIILNGVTDTNGNRPEFNFSGARTAAGCNPGGGNNIFTDTPAYGESLGGIVIKRGANDDYYTYKPDYIQIKNLEVYGASTGNTYITLTGATATYGTAAGIYMLPCRNVLIENCIVRQNSFGIFTMAKDEMLSQAVEFLTVRNNRIYDNGVVSSWFEHSCYIQVKQPVIEGNYMGQNRVGSLGSTYKSRSSGEIFRFNQVISSARAIDLVHSEEQSVDGIATQPEYGIDYFYGNVIINDDDQPLGGAPAAFHYGGDNLNEDDNDYDATALGNGPKYRKKLYFFGNTYYTRNFGNYRSSLFDISLRDIVVEAWNNVFIVNAYGSATELSWVEWAGVLNLRGVNAVYSNITLLDRRVDANPAWSSVNRLGTIITGDPRPLNISLYDFHPSRLSSAINAAGSGLPAGIPSELSVHTLNYETYPGLNGLKARNNVTALGALEFVDQDQVVSTMVQATSGGSGGGSSGGGSSGGSGGVAITGDVFLFDEPNGTLMTGSANWVGGYASSMDRYEVIDGALQCIAGTGSYGESVFYNNGQISDQSCNMLMAYPWSGALIMSVCTTATSRGYELAFSSATSFQFYKNGVWQNSGTIPAGSGGTQRLVLTRTGNAITLKVDGVTRYTFNDQTPLPNGYPGFSLAPGATVANQRLLEFKDVA